MFKFATGFVTMFIQTSTMTQQEAEDFYNFINEHINEDVSKLRLRYHGSESPWVNDAILQIECRKRFGKKLSQTLAENPRFIFPDTLAGEQSTGDITAQFHATLIEKDVDVVDLTCGLGIDSIHISRRARTVTACELDPHRADTLTLNAGQMNIGNLKAVNVNSIVALENGQLQGHTAFIDPARRSNDGGRVFSLSDCQPDIISMLPALHKNFKRLTAKVSPMLDITSLAAGMPGVTDIYVIGTPTECKELVACVDLAETSLHENTPVHAVTLGNDGVISTFTCSHDEESNTPQSTYGIPSTGGIIYIPYPAVQKTGAVKLLSQKYGLTRPAANTHLFFSDRETTGSEKFPGKAYRVVDIMPWQSKVIKRFKTTYPRGWVAVRNFGITAEALGKKLGIKPGGDLRIIGFSDNSNARYLMVIKPL